MLSVVLLPLLALLAAAQNDPPLNCANQITQADMNQCAARDFAEADAELNRVWPQARAEMQRRDRETARNRSAWDRRPGYAATLLTAQRTWLAHRDAQCAVEGYAARGGSMEPLLISQCLERLTRERIGHLAELAEDRE